MGNENDYLTEIDCPIPAVLHPLIFPAYCGTLSDESAKWLPAFLG